MTATITMNPPSVEPETTTVISYKTTVTYRNTHAGITHIGSEFDVEITVSELCLETAIVEPAGFQI